MLYSLKNIIRQVHIRRGGSNLISDRGATFYVLLSKRYFHAGANSAVVAESHMGNIGSIHVLQYLKAGFLVVKVFHLNAVWLAYGDHIGQGAVNNVVPVIELHRITGLVEIQLREKFKSCFSCCIFLHPSYALRFALLYHR